MGLIVNKSYLDSVQISFKRGAAGLITLTALALVILGALHPGALGAPVMMRGGLVGLIGGTFYMLKKKVSKIDKERVDVDEASLKADRSIEEIDLLLQATYNPAYHPST
ncbi:MAG: hypothetical protein S4CHLAM45_09690 [Chlamydiales bacterium]|nr:hypothetical protein [Chlamydiales bacterium]MCH9620213.1 hypothetical protein [Chlamydiales bacterium]MCH9623072.1 hypothetical protein [Chlamydiales bacterium]